MTTPHLIQDLKQDEGCRLTAYPDPLTHGAPYTIGFGHTGPEVHPGLTWTQDQADAALFADVDAACAELDRQVKWWRQLDDSRQDVLAELCFNLGWPKLSLFHHMWEALDNGDYARASDEILNSHAAAELPRRYNRLAAQMRFGVRSVVRAGA